MRLACHWRKHKHKHKHKFKEHRAMKPPAPSHPALSALAPVQPANPHLQRLGGPGAVVRLVAAFYRAMETRPDAATIRAMHDHDLGPTQQVLVTYLIEWMGGPKAYSAERGSPMLRRRHQAFDIDARARDAWLACMRQALDETCADAELRTQLDAALSKVADFIRNTETGGQQRPHPGRPMEVNPKVVPVTHSSS